MISCSRQGILLGYAQLVSGFAYIGLAPPESKMLVSKASCHHLESTH